MKLVAIAKKKSKSINMALNQIRSAMIVAFQNKLQLFTIRQSKEGMKPVHVAAAKNIKNAAYDNTRNGSKMVA